MSEQGKGIRAQFAKDRRRTYRTDLMAEKRQ